MRKIIHLVYFEYNNVFYVQYSLEMRVPEGGIEMVKLKEHDTNQFWFEKKNGADFPFYNDQPIKLSWKKWLIWVVLTIGSFFVFSGLILEPIIELLHLKENPSAAAEHPLRVMLLTFGILAIVFLIVFVTYALISGHRWHALFKKMTFKEFSFSALLGISGMILVVFYTKFILNDIFHIKTVADSAVQTNQDGKTGIQLWNFIEIVIQLIAEEMWAIVPFLFILMVCYKSFSMSRKTSIVIAWFISSLIFGLYHIPAYDGNIPQAILVIGVSRLFLTFTYIRYKNIWASYTTHIFWDLIPILAALIQGMLGK